jgi:hypothetical protein
VGGRDGAGGPERACRAARVTLHREVCAAAAASSSEKDFFARLAAVGVLVRQRMSTRTPAEVTGYAVALAQHPSGTGGVVWFGGGKLAADLTLPKLRRRWDPQTPSPPRPPAQRITPAGRNAAYEHAARQARSAAGHIRHCSASNPAQAADAAWAAADALRVAARTLRSRELRQAADAYDRAARAPHGRIPPRSPAGDQLRHAARAMAAIGPRSGPAAACHLILSLAELTAAVADLRMAQHHAAQAAAARRAAECLAAAAPRRHPPGVRRTQSHGRGSGTGRAEFPASLVLPQLPEPGAAVPGSAPPAPRVRSRTPRNRPRPPPRWPSSVRTTGAIGCPEPSFQAARGPLTAGFPAKRLQPRYRGSHAGC